MGFDFVAFSAIIHAFSETIDTMQSFAYTSLICPRLFLFFYIVIVIMTRFLYSTLSSILFIRYFMCDHRSYFT